MKLNILLVFTLVSCSFQGFSQQNLVPNPSFEEVSDCSGEAFGINRLNDWYLRLGTADFYHTCRGSSNLTNGVPQNRRGYQQAKTGNGYAGFFVYNEYGLTNEYLGVKLKQKLEKGKRYLLRYFVVASDESIYTNGFQAAFDDTTIVIGLVNGQQSVPNLIPIISNPSRVLIRDTINWVPISSCYIAQGWEKDFVIGNFKNNENTIIEKPEGATYNAYYYLDDVGVYEFDPLPDTILVCSNEEERIGSKFLNGEYLWSTGETDSVIFVNESGQYIVDVFIDDCMLSDTTYVLNVENQFDSLFADTSFCNEDGFLKLRIPIPGIYEWSTGQEGSNQIEVSESGQYALTVTNDCGQFQHTFEVEKLYCDIYVPNTFTPNGDGLNDEFEPLPNSSYVQIESLKIFDRWGSLVYEVKNPISWDGTRNGSDAAQGVYVYEINFYSQGVMKQKRGTITLLR